MGEAPTQRDKRFGLDQRLQELEAGVIGKVQVIDDHGLQPLRSGIAQRGVDRPVQQQALGFPGQRNGVAEFGQHQREFLGARGTQLDAMLSQHRAQQARQHGVGDAGVTRAGLDADDARAAAGQLVQQSALADARFADQQEHALRSPRRVPAPASSVSRPIRRGGRIRLAGATARRAGKAVGAALDGRHQLDRLGRRSGAEFVFQALLEALERGDRCGMVAAQVVQAQQAALGMLGQRVGIHQALGIDQAANDSTLPSRTAAAAAASAASRCSRQCWRCPRTHSARSGRSS